MDRQIAASKRLFWDDAEQLVFRGQVVALAAASNGEVDVELDRTAFYPEGGGQPDDRGTIEGRAVTRVIEGDGERIVHRVAAEAPEIRVGDEVEGRVDGVRRADHRQQHSGQHLLSAILVNRFSSETISFHLGPETCTLDLDVEISEDDLSAAERAVNRAIAGNLPVTPRFLDESDLAKEPLRKAPPAGVSRVRVLEIEGIDRTPCGGTHVSRTGELQLLLVLGRERRKKGLRVEFIAGSRAVSLASERVKGAQRITRELGCLPSDVPGRVSRLLEELGSARREMQLWRRRFLEVEIERLAAGAGGGDVVVRLDERTLDDAADLARGLAKRGSFAALGVVTEEGAGLVLATPGNRTPAGILAKQLAPVFGARGGGDAKFARLAGGSKDQLDAALDAARREFARSGTAVSSTI